MTALRRLLSGMSAAALSAFVLAGHGCGGSSFTSGGASDASDEGSNDATSPADGGADAFACVTVPVALSPQEAFCHAEEAILNRCRHCEACHQNDLNNCVAIGNALSTALVDAVVSCADKLGCESGLKGQLANPCVLDALGGATPTQAQDDVRNAYCTKCPSNPGECANFFNLSGDAGPDGGASGIGTIVLASNDAIAGQAAGCAITCNPLFYYLCTRDKICGATALDACGTGVCK